MWNIAVAIRRCPSCNSMDTGSVDFVAAGGIQPTLTHCLFPFDAVSRDTKIRAPSFQLPLMADDDVTRLVDDCGIAILFSHAGPQGSGKADSHLSIVRVPGSAGETVIECN